MCLEAPWGLWPAERLVFSLCFATLARDYRQKARSSRSRTDLNFPRMVSCGRASNRFHRPRLRSPPCFARLIDRSERNKPRSAPPRTPPPTPAPSQPVARARAARARGSPGCALAMRSCHVSLCMGRNLTGKVQLSAGLPVKAAEWAQHRHWHAGGWEQSAKDERKKKTAERAQVTLPAPNLFAGGWQPSRAT